MALEMTHQDVDKATVVLLDGRVVLGEETNAFRKKLKSLLVEGKRNIVLDLKKVSFIDSGGLGALIAAYSTAKSEGATLRLCNIGSRFKVLLQNTKLYTVFEVANSDAGAVRTAGKNRSDK
jgi:anti-sigma B factor antagonist